MKVFLTVDTEVWSFYGDLAKAIDSSIYGVTAEGEFGLRFELDLFRKYDIKANFFVEPLFTAVAGTKHLEDIITLIQSYGQDVQLHIHTEWLGRSKVSILPNGATGNNIKEFSVKDQSTLIKYGLARLHECGARNVCAFRAGNYGGSLDTLRALSENGVVFDTTHNTCYLDTVCDMRTPKLLLQPTLICGVYEFPITFFSDWPNHYRHMQIQACSIHELKHALLQARERGWFCVVIVLHSFEMMRRSAGLSCRSHKLDSIILGRLNQLCEFLADNRDRFQTTRFSELEKETIPSLNLLNPLKSNVLRTCHRYMQQLCRRLG